LYMLVSAYLKKAEEAESIVHPEGSCNCPCHGHDSSRPGSLSDHPETREVPRSPTSGVTGVEVSVARHDTLPSHVLSPTRTDTYPDVDEEARGLGIQPVTSNATIGGSRHEVTKTLLRIANSLGTPSPDRFDDSAFRHGKATGFPEVPGEGNRNSKLPQIKQQWGELNPDDDDGLTPRGRRSRANSFNGGSISRANSIGPRAQSTQPPPQRPQQPTDPGSSASFLGLPTTHSPESTSESVFPNRPSVELEKTKSQSTVVTLHQGPGSPAIVLSSDDEPGDASPPASREAISHPIEGLSPGEQSEK
jgi:hypothetical protein